jgi:hypothetical protein
MDFRRRFVFRGNASVIGGRIVRPSDVVIDSPTASSLTVAGGRSQARTIGRLFGDFVRHGPAATFAEGVFDDVKQQIEMTYGRVAEDTLTTSTHVTAEVHGLVVGAKPQLTIKRLRAVLNSKSPAGSGEPPIGVGSDIAIDGAAISGHQLIVELAPAVFQKYDTRSKLYAAADDPQFVRDFGACLFMTSTTGATTAYPAGRLVQGNGTTYGTVVRSIRWADTPFAGAKIDHNMVSVPELGKIFFGELLITDVSRRLTMVRLELGSPVGGAVACAEVDSDGTWSN